MRASLLLAPLAALLLSACGGGYESTVGQRLTLKDDDVSGSTIARDKDVNEWFDDEWQSFLRRAEEQLGRPPETVALRGASVQLDAANSKNVGTLEDVLVGDLVLYLKDPSTGAITDVARVKDPKGTGRVELDMIGSSLDALQPRLLLGHFKLGARGTNVKPLGSDFELALSVTLDVVAK